MQLYRAGIVIAVLAGVAAAAFLIIKNWDKIKPVVMKVKDAFISVMPAIKQTISNAIAAIMPIIQTLISTFKAVLPKAINTAKQVIASDWKEYLKIWDILFLCD